MIKKRFKRIVKCKIMNRDDWIQNIVLFILGISIIFLASAETYKTFNENNSTITFNITGITNSTNASSLVQIHFECIKYCQKNEQTESIEVKYCYEQCSKLGQEGICK